MKIILYLLFFLLSLSSLCQLQVDETYNSNPELEKKLNDYEIIFEFNDIQKKLLYQSMVNQISKNRPFVNGWVESTDVLKGESKVDTNSMFYFGLIHSKDSLFKKDSVYFSYYENKLDPLDKEVMYDDYGDEILVKKSFYSLFNQSFTKISTKENWIYSNQLLTKEVIATGIDFKGIEPRTKKHDRVSVFTLSHDSTQFIPFAKSVVTTRYFYPEYYKTFLNNDTISNHSFSEAIRAGLKAMSLNNQFEIENFLEPIMKDIRANKFKLLKIDSNNKILLEKVNSSEIDKLFWVINENSYSEDGDEIYIMTKDPIFPDNILGIEFHEDWYIGKNNFEIKKQVKGIVLIREEFDDEGNLKGMKKIPAYISFE